MVKPSIPTGSNASPATRCISTASSNGCSRCCSRTHRKLDVNPFRKKGSVRALVLSPPAFLADHRRYYHASPNLDKGNITMMLTRSETSIQLTYTPKEYEEFNHALVAFR